MATPLASRPSYPNLNVIASLKVISFLALLNGESSAAADLHDAGVKDGFFYLDLRNPQTQMLLDEVEKLYDVAENIFRLPLEHKLKYDADKIGPAKIDGSASSSCFT
jgi:isopenicillin N synthase-like dioxygenase